MSGPGPAGERSREASPDVWARPSPEVHSPPRLVASAPYPATGRGDVRAAAAPFAGMYDDGPSGVSVVEAAIESAEALTAKRPPDRRAAEAALVPAVRWVDTVIRQRNAHDRFPDGLNASTAAMFAGAAQAEIQGAILRLRLGQPSDWGRCRAVVRAAAEHLQILSGEKGASTWASA